MVINPLLNGMILQANTFCQQMLDVEQWSLDKGHYITNPINALLQGKFLKITINLYCLVPTKWVI